VSQPAEWPDICARCGGCCRYKAQLLGGEKILTPLHCPHLDRATRLCRVYETRHTAHGACMSARQALTANCLPDSCPYVKRYGARDYRGPRSMPWAWWAEHREYLQALAVRLGVGPAELAAIVADCEAGRW